MALYHINVKPISRAKGRSSTASAAYRSGEKIVDLRTGEIFDYTRKQKVDHTELIGFDGTRSELWNAAEASEKRKDATVAREYEVALPVELTREQNIELAREYAKWIHDRHGVAVDLCLHDLAGENPHAHILTTTRVVVNGRELGDKAAREWSDTKRGKSGLPGRKADLNEAREKWADLQNQAFKKSGHEITVDHRSFKERGIDRVPTKHLGPAATAIERRGRRSRRGSFNRIINNLTFIRLDAEAQLLLKMQRDQVQMVTAPVKMVAEMLAKAAEKRIKIYAKERDIRKRVYLNVPFSRKELAKEAGAQWDRDKTKWFAPDKENLGKLEQWTQKPEPDTEPEAEAVNKPMGFIGRILAGKKVREAAAKAEKSEANKIGAARRQEIAAAWERAERKLVEADQERALFEAKKTARRADQQKQTEEARRREIEQKQALEKEAAARAVKAPQRQKERGKGRGGGGMEM